MEHLLEVRRDVLERIKASKALTKLRSGEGGREVYAKYLMNVWHYAQHSAIVIGMAGARAVADNPKLADYLLHHAREELGHERVGAGRPRRFRNREGTSRGISAGHLMRRDDRLRILHSWSC